MQLIDTKMLRKFLIFYSLLTLTSCVSYEYIIDRSKLEPTSNSQESVGFYSNGCINGAKALPDFGYGYQLAFVERNKHWGHNNLIEMTQSVFKKTYQKHGKAFWVGDLSLSRGGPTQKGHSSHQNGLDIDIFFETVEESNSPKLKSFLLADGKIDYTRWNAAHNDLVVNFAKNNKVERIFIHPAFKKHFCKNNDFFKLSIEELKKIRPWYGHDEHIHVRVTCPSSSASCNKQKPIMDTDTCGKDLDWWFSEDAKYEDSDYAKNVHDIENHYLSRLKALPHQCKPLMIKNKAKH